MSRVAELSALRRKPDDGLVAGVCAGLADFYGWRVRTVRFVVAALILLVSWPVVLAYLVACFLIPADDEDEELERPTPGRSHRHERRSDRRARRKARREAEASSDAPPRPRYTGALRERYARIESRMRRVEAYLHGNEYHLRSAFRDLETP